MDRRTLLGGLAAAVFAGTGSASATDHLLAHFRALVFLNEEAHLQAIETLRAHGGAELVPGLIFALRYTRQDDGAILALLGEITGETQRLDWFDWMLWQEDNPGVIPHASYRDFKRELFFRIDPNFEDFLKTEYLDPDRMRIRFEEITWGGVRKDGIPSLDFANMIPGKEADYLVGSDFVFGISINGDTRAYPLRIMGWHEMFNDVIGGVPLALAYCTLCGAGILFETDVEGRNAPFIFGSSGFLYRSNKLMFDRETHSLWNQFTGKPVMGPLVDSGLELRQRAVVIEPWLRWYERHPDTQVLSLETGFERDYGSGVVYDKYFSSPDLMFPARVDQTRLQQKDYVFGIRTFGGAKAWPVTAFEGGRVINDAVAGLNVVLVGDRLGRTVRAYERRDLTFQPGDRPDRIISDGETWSIGEEAILGPNGEKLPRVPGHVAYWFAWDGYLGVRSELFEG